MLWIRCAIYVLNAYDVCMSTATVTPMPRRSFADEVAANVRAETARLGLRQADLAGVLGIDQSLISNRWRGRTPWRLEELEAIAPMLGTTASMLCAIRDSNPGPADLGSAQVIDLSAYRIERAS